jgi:RNA-directed DNA polymerase
MNLASRLWWNTLALFHPTSLANLTLDGLQAQLLHAFGRRQKINQVRYADDFIITADNPLILEQEVKPLVARFLAHRGLTRSPEKTHITSIHTGFDF